MKYLKTFNTKSEYKTAKKAHSIQVPYACMTVDDYTVYTRPAFVEKQYAEAGDIIVYSKAAYEAWTNAESGSTAEEAAYQTLVNSTTYMRPEYFDATAAQKYVPEAIVVVPYNHTGDGTVRAMSLKWMNPNAPESGTNDNSITVKWGANNVNIPDIPEYNGGATLVSIELGEASTLSSANPTYLPSDSFSALEVPGSDTEFYWYQTTGNHAPCPYRSDGSLNRQYLGEYGVNSKLTNNCFADMDGMHNTKAIINTLDKTYIDYTLFNTTITNGQRQTIEGVSTNIFPSAMCCQRYKTVLKSNVITYDSENDVYSYGDWYLPSAGEIGYGVASNGIINYALNRINNIVGNIALWKEEGIWTSTEYSSGLTWANAISQGLFIGHGKGNVMSVRAFAKF